MEESPIKNEGKGNDVEKEDLPEKEAVHDDEVLNTQALAEEEEKIFEETPENEASG